jgi:hypothetical protein
LGTGAAISSTSRSKSGDAKGPSKLAVLSRKGVIVVQLLTFRAIQFPLLAAMTVPSSRTHKISRYVDLLCSAVRRNRDTRLSRSPTSKSRMTS